MPLWILSNGGMLVKLTANVPQPYFSAGLIALNNIKSTNL